MLIPITTRSRILTATVVGSLLCGILPAYAQQEPAAEINAASSATYYVDKGGSNGDARSPQTAWNEMNKVDWARIRPGDTLVLREGTYTTPMVVKADGTAAQPIMIKAEGKVVLFGGRDTPLPYCGQSNWRGEDAQTLGMDLSETAHVQIDGVARNGIVIKGWEQGVQFDTGTQHIVMRNMEVTDNGAAKSSGGGVDPWRPGLRVTGGSDILFEYMTVHDNGGDAFQSNGDLKNFVIRDSWVYNKRNDPSGEVFNACAHPDGLQVTASPDTDAITLERTVFGPGVYHTFLQNAGTSTNHVFRDLLIYDALTSTIAVRTSGARNWLIEYVTSVVPAGKLNVELTGSNLTIKNSLFVGGSIWKLPSTISVSNSYSYQVRGEPIGNVLDPQFRSLSSDDYTPLGNVNGAGSRVLTPFGEPASLSGEEPPPGTTPVPTPKPGTPVKPTPTPKPGTPTKPKPGSRQTTYLPIIQRTK